MPFINPKFHSDGSPKPFYGNTIICPVPYQSQFFKSLVEIQEKLKKTSIAKKMVFLPPESFHMTIIGLDHFKQWNEKDIKASDDHCIKALEKIEFFESIKVKPNPTIKVGKIAIMLEVDPITESDKAMLSKFQKDVMRTCGKQLKTHHLHVTLAYKLQEFTGDECHQIKLLDDEIAKAMSHGDTWDSGKPLLTFYADMLKFVPQELLNTVRIP